MALKLFDIDPSLFYKVGKMHVETEMFLQVKL